jgi:hypothetical protein
VNDDYLWDGSGEADPEVVRLEQLLGRHRHRAPLRLPSPRRNRVWLAVAAALVLVAGAVVAAYYARLHWTPNKPWRVIAVSGTARAGGRLLAQRDRLAVGETLRTDSRSTVSLRVARIGELRVGPSSEVTLTETRPGAHRMTLVRGTMYARLWAPPFYFGVRTPAGLASDIGCEFVLRYDGHSGVVRVLSGWVDFDGPMHSALIPGGAVAELREGRGPGTPYYEDASVEFRTALRVVDENYSDEAALRRLLAAARPRDAMTLLHLYEQESLPDEAVLVDRMLQLAPPPPNVTREGLLRGDDQMRYEYRQFLGLGSIKKWWLQWRDVLPR